MTLWLSADMLRQACEAGIYSKNIFALQLAMYPLDFENVPLGVHVPQVGNLERKGLLPVNLNLSAAILIKIIIHATNNILIES